jgi:hypothetical protein
MTMLPEDRAPVTLPSTGKPPSMPGVGSHTGPSYKEDLQWTDML